MKIMTSEEYEKIYMDQYIELPIEKRAQLIEQIKDKTEQEEMRRLFCNDLLYYITTGYTKYKTDEDFETNPIIKLFNENVEKLNNDDSFFWSMYYFYKRDYRNCIDKIKVLLSESLNLYSKENNSYISFIDEDVFVDCFLEPYKNAFDGFWEQLYEILNELPVEQDIKDFCRLINAYYTIESEDEIIDKLIKFINKYPYFKTPKELLGIIYYDKGMWRNAIGYFEMAIDDGQNMLFPMTDIYFILAWSYSKCKDHKQEEMYYRKAVETNRYYPFLLNNLGYCLYKQKKYNEAKTIFEECLEKKIDVKYAANNYVRVLIATGRNKDAKAFIKKGEFRVIKSLKDKVNRLDNTNARIKKDLVVTEADEEKTSVENNNIDFGIKRQQFSSEKILEDELTVRIESGMPVFGMNLKLYNHKGDFYGRQYPFPYGRLDLLCENEKGDLYIIELKKDSGYDDVYKQISEYIDWFEKAPISKGKKVYGIICLNAPSKELVDKVRKDNRIKLYEYQISYTEIK